MTTKFDSWLLALSSIDRLLLAKKLCSDLVGRALWVHELHESNRIVVYSPVLAAQIPDSHAAHAFESFRRSNHLFEVTQLCALWDKPGKNRVSIPTLVRLLDHPDVQRLVSEALQEHWGYGSFEKQRAATNGRWADEAIELTKQIERSSRLKGLRNYRDKNLAHFLSSSNDEDRGVTFAIPKYGDERRLLRAASRIVWRLYLGVCLADFDFEGAILNARRDAQQLWHNCKFEIPVRQ